MLFAVHLLDERNSEASPSVFFSQLITKSGQTRFRERKKERNVWLVSVSEKIIKEINQEKKTKFLPFPLNQFIYH